MSNLISQCPHPECRTHSNLPMGTLLWLAGAPGPARPKAPSPLPALGTPGPYLFLREPLPPSLRVGPGPSLQVLMSNPGL